MKVMVSVSSLTKADVADLRSIQARMQSLVERAEHIIQKSNEVFPQARSGWLRKIKAALGILPVRDSYSLEDTINFCERLVSASSKTHVRDALDWASDHRYVLKDKDLKPGQEELKPLPVGQPVPVIKVRQRQEALKRRLSDLTKLIPHFAMQSDMDMVKELREETRALKEQIEDLSKIQSPSDLDLYASYVSKYGTQEYR